MSKHNHCQYVRPAFATGAGAVLFGRTRLHAPAGRAANKPPRFVRSQTATALHIESLGSVAGEPDGFGLS